MILPYRIISTMTTIRVTRRLPRQGKLVVGIGERVEAVQLIGQTRLPGTFHIVDVARELGISPKKVKKHLKAKVGVRVQEGAILADRGGIGGHRCQAPIDGMITGYSRGRLLLESPPKRFQLNALVPGNVIETWPGEAVMIESTGALLQATWGNGQEGYGVLKVAVSAARRTLRARQIDASAQGTVLVGGSQLDEEALERAVEMRVRGIIVGGVPVDLIPRLMKVDFPILATEGVGKVPMSQAAFKLLRSMDGREVAVSGQLKIRWGAELPFIAIPMPARSINPIQPRSHLTVGDRVLGLREPYLGVSGSVMETPMAREMIETGARVRGVRVKFDGAKDIVFVPFLNLERVL